ncbi:DUF3159 domain-containing protein [Streptomyces lydicus]|uniref:DUF3159 domain-containing protein n=1 Tax=Streptomyces lydicus TaxID=47763 RepID=UPI002870159E|nr:DUF3159 domain-containing protein [Streptomyces lydicus]
MDRAAHPEPGSDDAAGAAIRGRLRSGVLDVAPVLGFTVSLSLTHRVAVALPVALAVGAAGCVVRLVRGEPVRRTLGVIGIVGVGGALAALTGQATSFFVPSLVMHCVMAVATPVLLLLGWPPMGLAVGLITGERTAWRRCPVRRRGFIRGNLAIMAGSYVLLALQLPLFLSGQAVALGTVETLGPVVLALGTLLGWRVYRRVVGTHRCPDSHPGAETSHPLERTPS